MATYEIETKTDIKFICLLDREVTININNFLIYIEYSNYIF